MYLFLMLATHPKTTGSHLCLITLPALPDAHRRMMMHELGWDPEWEVNPKELKLIEKIGQYIWQGMAHANEPGRASRIWLWHHSFGTYGHEECRVIVSSGMQMRMAAPAHHTSDLLFHFLCIAGSGEFGDVYKAKWHGSFVSMLAGCCICIRSDRLQGPCMGSSRCGHVRAIDRGWGSTALRRSLTCIALPTAFLDTNMQCFDLLWSSQVAAKLLKRSDEIALGDFRTEIAILRKIHHPNTTQFLGACTKQKVR